MKRILLKLAVSVLAFVLGVTVSVLWRFHTYADAPACLADISADMPDPTLSVDGVVIGCGADITQTSYILSNGSEITRVCQHYLSAAQANNVFQAKRAGFDMVEWSANLDSNGRRIGEKVVVISGHTFVRLSIQGNTLCETRAPSFDKLRWFENGGFH